MAVAEKVHCYSSLLNTHGSTGGRPMSRTERDAGEDLCSMNAPSMHMQVVGMTHKPMSHCLSRMVTMWNCALMLARQYEETRGIIWPVYAGQQEQYGI